MCDKKTKCPSPTLCKLDKKNCNGVDRGFKWECYTFMEPYNPDRLPSYHRDDIPFRLRNPLIMKLSLKRRIKPVNYNSFVIKLILLKLLTLPPHI